jgi:hypothetical protein
MILVTPTVVAHAPLYFDDIVIFLVIYQYKFFFSPQVYIISYCCIYIAIFCIVGSIFSVVAHLCESWVNTLPQVVSFSGCSGPLPRGESWQGRV